MKFFFIFKFFTLLVISGFLAGCGLVEGAGKHLQPLSGAIKSKISNIGSTPSEAMLIRLFKEENVLEVWKQKSNGTYALLKSYEICAWSGQLGPKFKEGDRQAPEGFYTVTPGRMNPNSSYYLSFNTGFPNKFDRAHGRTGTDLMVHGDCSSRGCYSMTDESIAEIYALGRESFRGGQRSFQLQLYPFRMSAKNLAKHYKSPHVEFWQNLKIGYDAFEISKTLPSWDVCEGRYIFNAKNPPASAFGACPTQSTKPELMAQVMAKQQTDLAEFNKLVATYEDDATKRIALAEKRELEKKQAAERTAALNAAINEQTLGISNAVGGFFGGLFGGGQKVATPADIIAPIPMPPPNRN